MYKDTFGMCSKCYKTVPAILELKENGAFITKFCPEHGEETFLIDPDSSIYGGKPGPYWAKVIESTGIESTDRCNMKCKACYHDVANTEDKPIKEIVQLSKRASSNRIILMGAEPTMRKDLPLLISSIKSELSKDVYIYTNGLNLDNINYLQSLINTGLNGLCFSLHTKNENTKVTWKRKQVALENLSKILPINKDFVVSHIAFSLQGINELDEAIQLAMKFKHIPHHYRIRLPAQAGTYIESGFYLSDLIAESKKVAAKYGYFWRAQKAGNSAYHKVININGVLFRFIRVPPAYCLDFRQLPNIPKAIYVEEIKESNFTHQLAIQDGIRIGIIKPEKVINWSDYDLKVKEVE